MADVKDLVLIHIDGKPGFYARIEEIAPDVKKGWWQVKLLALSIPVQVFTWILDSGQVDGEPFTMGGTPVRLEKVVTPPEEAAAPEPSRVREPKREPAKVVSLADRKKEK